MDVMSTAHRDRRGLGNFSRKQNEKVFRERMGGCKYIVEEKRKTHLTRDADDDYRGPANGLRKVGGILTP